MLTRGCCRFLSGRDVTREQPSLEVLRVAQSNDATLRDAGSRVEDVESPTQETRSRGPAFSLRNNGHGF